MVDSKCFITLLIFIAYTCGCPTCFLSAKVLTKSELRALSGFLKKMLFPMPYATYVSGVSTS